MKAYLHDKQTQQKIYQFMLPHSLTARNLWSIYL